MSSSRRTCPSFLPSPLVCRQLLPEGTVNDSLCSFFSRGHQSSSPASSLPSCVSPRIQTPNFLPEWCPGEKLPGAGTQGSCAGFEHAFIRIATSFGVLGGSGISTSLPLVTLSNALAGLAHGLGFPYSSGRS